MINHAVLKKVNEQLVEVQFAEREIGRYSQRLIYLQAKLPDEQAKLNNLHVQLESELLDVERLEGETLHALFYILLGRKKEQLETERHELLQASYAYDHCRSRIDGLQAEVRVAEKMLKRSRRDLVIREGLLEQKAKLLHKTQHHEAAKLGNIEQKIEEISWQLREITEAIGAGKRVEFVLNKALAALGKASSWGVLDLLGMGLLSTSIKHSYIDISNEEVKYAEQLMDKFQCELNDLTIDQKLQIEVTDFDKFADYFFDGLLFDWIVQKTIDRAYKNVRTIQMKVINIMKQLENRKEQVTQQHMKAQKRREWVLASAE